MPRYWFDAHLDLAYLAVRGRDMLAPLASLREPTEGPDPPAAVTLPSLRDGGVRFALATIFTEPVERGEVDTAGEPLTAEQYPAGDAEAAHRRGRAQLEAYLTWRDRGLLELSIPAGLRAQAGVGEVRGGMGVSEVLPPSIESRVAGLLRRPVLHVGILMENADPIRSPDELTWWADRGVCAVGLCWARPSRYAHGNATPLEHRAGLTPAGRELLGEMARCGVVPDVSHLSDRSLDDVLAAHAGPVIASHSNCRSLLDRPGGPANQRHLTDRAIREIVRRGGVVGINLYSAFLVRPGGGANAAGQRRATIDEALAHIERVCELAGDRRHVGLGSDMDGGFSAERLPADIGRPADLRLLTDALGRRGWDDDDVEGFAWKNWARFFGGD